MILPADTARCPGRAVFDKRTYKIRTDMQCEGCQRLTTGRAETAQWIADGRPRVDGGRPLMRCVWMAAPYPPVWPCSSRIEPHVKPDTV